MANSNVTKKALATSLKELTKEKPLSKITIKDICVKSEMNRKSFYYHFKDKNDLINWIFDYDVAQIVKDNNRVESQRKVLDYLYENKSFYKKAFRQEDQNCLADHIKEKMMPVIKARTEHIDEIKTFEFYTEFVADSIVYSIKKWLLFNDHVRGEEFFNQLAACMRYTATKILIK